MAFSFPQRYPLLSEISPLVPLFAQVFDALRLPYVVRKGRDPVSRALCMRVHQDIALYVVAPTPFASLCAAQGYSPARPLLGFADFTSRTAFVQEGSAACVIAVAAHELGHLLKPRIPQKRDEEAAAYAFEYACACALQHHRIEGCRYEVVDEALSPPHHLFPAHVKAHHFVTQNLLRGEDPLELYRELTMGNLWVPTKRRKPAL
ncbi:hypothetical protein EXS73_02140 [Candidatus Pacearchaeota archaeon]|nr:hypothetical protein [Candidatus Pacearchaeota archaeon]